MCNEWIILQFIQWIKVTLLLLQQKPGEQEGAAARGGVTGGNIINVDESDQDQDNDINNQTFKDDKDVFVYAN